MQYETDATPVAIALYIFAIGCDFSWQAHRPGHWILTILALLGFSLWGARLYRDQQFRR